MYKRDPLNAKYSHMKERCCNPNSKSYARYGGREIKVCDEWMEDYHAFKSWALSHGYKKELDIDRIDNDGPYAPWNCRFVSRKQNSRNTSRCKFYTYNGKTKNLSQWCEELDLDYRIVYMRINRGMDFENAISLPKREWNLSNLIGVKFGKLTVIELCEDRTKEGRVQYICKCECGNYAKVQGKLLRNGKTKSCGCLSEKFFKKYAVKNKYVHRKDE